MASERSTASKDEMCEEVSGHEELVSGEDVASGWSVNAEDDVIRGQQVRAREESDDVPSVLLLEGHCNDFPKGEEQDMPRESDPAWNTNVEGLALESESDATVHPRPEGAERRHSESRETFPLPGIPGDGARIKEMGDHSHQGDDAWPKASQAVESMGEYPERLPAGISPASESQEADTHLVDRAPASREFLDGLQGERSAPVSRELDGIGRRRWAGESDRQTVKTGAESAGITAAEEDGIPYGEGYRAQRSVGDVKEEHNAKDKDLNTKDEDLNAKDEELNA
eukprot:g19262.t1